MKKPVRVLSMIAALLLAAAQAHGQNASAQAGALLDAAVAAMGGARVEQLNNFVMTGFGQRYNFNGNISADPNSPPKWQAVATSERYFDLRGERALPGALLDDRAHRGGSIGHAALRRPVFCSATLEHRASAFREPVAGVACAQCR